ncbi:MAG: o-succinylbenzoate--CoA ligase, partial [Anaerolineae bacterium]
MNQDFLSLAAASHPHRLAIWDGETRLNYAQLNRRVAQMCARLHAWGVRRGERVAVLLRRDLESILLVHALARLGAVLVPLNTRLTPDEMRWQVEAADCAHVLSCLPGVALPAAVPLAALPSVAESDTWLQGTLNLESDFGVLFTSGTTGRPKGAVLTWGNLFWSALGSAFRLGVLPDDRWLLTLPLYHIGGLAILFRSALYGTAVVLPGFPDDRFDLDVLRTRLRESRPTLVSLVPTMLYRLLPQDTSGPDRRRETADAISSLRLILLGGAAASPELLARAFDLGLPVAVTYGLTEAA